jgi:hypothetical protein
LISRLTRAASGWLANCFFASWRVKLGFGPYPFPETLRRAVFALVLKLGLALVGTGLAIGVAMALGLNGFMKEHFWLYHVKATDPATYAAVGTLFLSVAMLALRACPRRDQRGSHDDPAARVTLVREGFGTNQDKQSYYEKMVSTLTLLLSFSSSAIHALPRRRS